MAAELPRFFAVKNRYAVLKVQEILAQEDVVVLKWGLGGAGIRPGNQR